MALPFVMLWNNLLSDKLDFLQFSHQASQLVDDGFMLAFHVILQHLKFPGCYICLLFVDYNKALPSTPLFHRSSRLLSSPSQSTFGSSNTSCTTLKRIRVNKHLSNILVIITHTSKGYSLSLFLSLHQQVSHLTDPF